MDITALEAVPNFVEYGAVRQENDKFFRQS